MILTTKDSANSMTSLVGPFKMSQASFSSQPNLIRYMSLTLDETEKALLKNINKKDLEIFLKVISQMQENLKEERMDIC